MFEIGWSELLVIAIVAIIVIGPKDLPHVMRTLGQWIAGVRRQADEFRRQFEDSVRESGVEDIQRNLQQLRDLNPANQIRDSIDQAFRESLKPPPMLTNMPDDPTVWAGAAGQGAIAGEAAAETKADAPIAPLPMASVSEDQPAAAAKESAADAGADFSAAAATGPAASDQTGPAEHPAAQPPIAAEPETAKPVLPQAMRVS